MTQAQAIETIIATLEHTQARPAMYMHNAQDLEAAQGFLDGFSTPCMRLGYGYGQKVQATIFTQRGWYRAENRAELLSQKTGKNMKESGMSDAEIIQELFAIEIDCWKTLRDSPTKP